MMMYIDHASSVGDTHAHTRAQMAIGEIGAALSETIKGRSSSKDITLFKSVGAAVEDLYAAALIYETATH